MLGEIGKGHKVALNTLNYGRFSLGAMCAGGCRGPSATRPDTRHSGGSSTSRSPRFGAIKHKLGEMIARTYAWKASRIAPPGLIDARARRLARRRGDWRGCSRNTPIESSIAKVVGTEILDYVLDENVQIHGGNGFVKDYTAERYYRDARVNRIFEGTNEINRMLIPGMLVTTAVKGDLQLIPAAKRLQDELLTPSTPATASASQRRSTTRSRTVAAFKKVVADGPRHRDADLRRQAVGPAGSSRYAADIIIGDLRC